MLFRSFQTQQGNIYNRLAGIAGLGQAAQNQTNQAGTNATNAIGQLGVGAAGALGSGQIGAANAMAGGLQGIGNAGYLASLIQPSTTPTDMTGFQTPYTAPTYSTSSPGLGSGLFTPG